MPQGELSVKTMGGLRADSARRDVAGESTRSEKGNDWDWSDVPDDGGYGPIRDAIVRHVNALLAGL